MIREELEMRECDILSPFAMRAKDTRGRLVPEEECDIRTAYMRDRDRIVHCKSFRRLKDKTQVFLAPQGDHYRTRLMHTLEVSQTARTAAKALRLNEDLVEAIALGHDLGHTPFGHAGERALNRAARVGFKHAEQSLRIVDVLEKDGTGLNLTWEVRDGILNHGTDCHPATLEGQVVRFCDKISYVHHDMDDAERAGLLSESDIPERLRKLLGYSTRERLNTFIHDLVENSEGKDHIEMSEEIGSAMFELRQFLYDNLYTNPAAKSEEKKAEEMVEQLFHFYAAHPEEMTVEYVRRVREGETAERAALDYISGMTDQYSMMKFREIYIPKSWDKL